jgi:hypothetical protein
MFLEVVDAEHSLLAIAIRLTRLHQAAAVKHHPLRHPAPALAAITQPLFEKS